MNADNYVPAWFYEGEEEAYIEEEPDYPPSNIDARCYIGRKVFSSKDLDEDGWFQWKGEHRYHMKETVPCRIVDAEVLLDYNVTA